MMIENILKDTQPRLIYTVMITSLLLFVLASYLYLLKKPLAEYSELKQARILLQVKMENKTKLSNDIERLKKEVDQLNRRLHGKKPVKREHEMLAHKINTLDNLSSYHKVQLLSVKPGSPRIVSMFKEISFDVEVAGQYQQLYTWLHEVEMEFGSMVVKQFEVRPKTDSKDLYVKMKMAFYSPSREVK